jgi:hypothetical protein
LFFEYLYATLAAWGLHYRGAKLVNFDVFQERVKQQQKNIMKLQNKNILTLKEEERPELVESLWEIMESISVSESQTQLIAGSKTLHHLLPRIIPPIDRRYSLRFFYGEGRSPSYPDKHTFTEIYPVYCDIASENRNEINSLLGNEFNTSETKIIDNAIVGFILEEPDTKIRK